VGLLALIIEAAIVLGVVGLVLGGIWIAATAVRDNQTIQEVAAGALSYRQNVRALTKSTGTFAWLIGGANTAQFRLDASLLPASWAVDGFYNVAPGGIRVSNGGRDSVILDQRSTGLFYVFTPGQRHLPKSRQ
jgi:hypothetical protein